MADSSFDIVSKVDRQEVDNALNQAAKELATRFDFRGTDLEYFQAILHGVPASVSTLEEHFSPFLDIALEKLGPIERAVLRLATWELAERIDVPWRVVLDEAVALTRKFGATDSHRFVNAVLDRVAHELRPLEAGRGA